MRISLKIAVLFVGIWFTGKMIFFYTQILQDEASVKFQVMWNILCLLLGMTIGTIAEKRSENRQESSALGDIKNTLGGGLLYTVLVAGLLYLYYAKIDPSYNANQLAKAEEVVKSTLDDPAKMKELRKDPEMEVLTKEEIYNKAMTNYRSMFNPVSTMTISLLGMLILSTVNAILLTVIFRRILFKQRTF
ncbi:DUF4199 domain-containing protein [Fluviicola sp.]|uniref:DUF4199 domain-containing protein n=1 Tax=Fluviicola sp. TaxID=1917219 RepID=UPI0031DA83B7